MYDCVDEKQFYPDIHCLNCTIRLNQQSIEEITKILDNLNVIFSVCQIEKDSLGIHVVFYVRQNSI